MKLSSTFFTCQRIIVALFFMLILKISANGNACIIDNEKVLHVVDIETSEPLLFSVFSNGSPIVENVDSFALGDSFSETAIEIKSKNYFSKFLDPTQITELKYVVGLNPLKEGKSIRLEHILFEKGSTKLKSSSMQDLILVFEMLQENPSTRILIKGHTDNVGDPVQNKRLSQARVKVIRGFLMGRGIPPSRIEGKGFGGEQPIFSNDTEENRDRNRRVEFEIISN